MIWLLILNLNFAEPYPFHFKSKSDCVKLAESRRMKNYKCVAEIVN